MTASASAHRPYGVAIAALLIPVVATALVVPHAHADNNRLNRSVVQMVSVVQYRAAVTTTSRSTRSFSWPPSGTHWTS